MKCPKCEGEIHVTHSYSAGVGGKTQRGQCNSCLKKFTLVTVVLEADRHGEGAYAVARKMKDGERPASLH